jgi:hypothetical protein
MIQLVATIMAGLLALLGISNQVNNWGPDRAVVTSANTAATMTAIAEKLVLMCQQTNQNCSPAGTTASITSGQYGSNAGCITSIAGYIPLFPNDPSDNQCFTITTAAVPNNGIRWNITSPSTYLGQYLPNMLAGTDSGTAFTSSAIVQTTPYYLVYDECLGRIYASSTSTPTVDTSC